MRYKLLIFTLLISILINTVITTKVCADIVKKEDFWTKINGTWIICKSNKLYY